jgi:hypothetical protein
MVSMQSIDAQLDALGIKFRLIGRPEIEELQHILVPQERILQCINGLYDGGVALLCATDQRLLLVDKKPWFLTLEDIGYDMISEVDYRARLLDATTTIHTPSKMLNFRSWHQPRLRMLTSYVQQRIMELRSYWQQVQPGESPLAQQIQQRGAQLTPKQLIIRPQISKFGMNISRHKYPAVGTK